MKKMSGGIFSPNALVYKADRWDRPQVSWTLEWNQKAGWKNSVNDHLLELEDMLEPHHPHTMW